MELAVPVQAVEDRTAFLKQQVKALKDELEADLGRHLNAAIDSLPESLRSLTLGQFLALISIVEPEVEPVAKRKKTILGLDSEEVKRLTFANIADPGRRLTRSMTARLRQESFGGMRDSGVFGPVPSTPRLFPGLPETPAAIRQQLKNSSMAANPVRIAGSTIRATIKPEASKQAPTVTKADCRDENRAPENKAPNPVVQNLIHMELSDGKIVDLDLTKSPGSVFTGISKEKTGEVKEWLSQYASAFTNFLKRLGS